jgi:hypothetical protein
MGLAPLLVKEILKSLRHKQSGTTILLVRTKRPHGTVNCRHAYVIETVKLCCRAAPKNWCTAKKWKSLFGGIREAYHEGGVSVKVKTVSPAMSVRCSWMAAWRKRFRIMKENNIRVCR